MLPKDFDKKMRLELMAGNLVKAFKGLFIDVIVWEQLATRCLLVAAI